MDLSTIVALLPARYAVYAAALFGACALVSALWPTPHPDSRILPLWRLVNLLGGNFKYAANLLHPDDHIVSLVDGLVAADANAQIKVDLSPARSDNIVSLVHPVTLVAPAPTPPAK